MMNTRDVLVLMAILVPLILGIVVFCFFQFIKWSRKDQEKRRP